MTVVTDTARNTVGLHSHGEEAWKTFSMWLSLSPTQGAVQGWCAPSYSPTVPSAIAATLTAPPRCAGLWRAITSPPLHLHQVTAPSAPRERKRSTPGWTCLSLVGRVWCVLCGVLCGACCVVCVLCGVLRGVCCVCCLLHGVWCVLESWADQWYKLQGDSTA